jgi:hypothetical protein
LLFLVFCLRPPLDGVCGGKAKERSANGRRRTNASGFAVSIFQRAAGSRAAPMRSAKTSGVYSCAMPGQVKNPGEERFKKKIQKIADNREWKMPATIDDPAVLDEMQTVLENIGCAKFRMRPSYCPIPAIIRRDFPQVDTPFEQKRNSYSQAGTDSTPKKLFFPH